jgi:hypothetical protein
MGMKRISSKATYALKRLFPMLWFGVLLASVIVAGAAGVWRLQPALLLVPLLMGLIGLVVMKAVIWDLADEVYDCGDYLLVKSRGIELQVPLAGIINVNSTVAMNPPRITLRLADAGALGAEIVFAPVRRFSFNPFARNPIADELVLRVDRARRQRGR